MTTGESVAGLSGRTAEPPPLEPVIGAASLPLAVEAPGELTGATPPDAGVGARGVLLLAEVPSVAGRRSTCTAAEGDPVDGVPPAAGTSDIPSTVGGNATEPVAEGPDAAPSTMSASSPDL